MKFVVAIYGGKHAGMLLAHLHAILRTHPGAEVEVYHQDLPGPVVKALIKGHLSVQWIETKFDFARDKILRISSKTLAWEFAMRRQPEGETVCLLDVDTLVRKDLRPFFADAVSDVIFTFKRGGFVLNSGVLLCRINQRTRAFFERWRSDTVGILQDPARFRQANDPALPYGGADQMALHQMLGYREGQSRYEIEIEAQLVRFRAEPCEVLNETRSRPLAEGAHILHYKGGWQPILLDGRRFSRHRPKALSWEMYLFYLETFRDALRLLNETLGAGWQARDFHICIPRYVDAPGPLRRWLQYAAFVAADHLRDAAALGRSLWRLVTSTRDPSCRS